MQIFNITRLKKYREALVDLQSTNELFLIHTFPPRRQLATVELSASSVPCAHSPERGTWQHLCRAL